MYQRKLKRQLQSRPQAAVRGRVNLETAHTVGILFDATELSQRKTIQQFAEKLRLQSKEVKLLGYVDNKGEAESFSFPSYNQKDLDWTKAPKGEEVQKFIDQKFDLLLVLTPHAASHMEYISALAYAHLKVGPSTPNTYSFDLMIDTGRQNDLSGFIEQVEQLLKKTNVKKAATTPV